MRIKLCLAALAVTAAAVATPAAAQQVTTTTTATATATVNNATAEGTVLLPLTLTESKTLDFGTVIASSTAGTVTIDADSGGRSVTGGVIGVPNYPGRRGLFQGAGTKSQDVILTMTPPSVLTSGTNSIAVNSMTFDNNGGTNTTRTIDGSGAFAVGVGGEFAIAADQPNGYYSASYTVTADYQ